MNASPESPVYYDLTELSISRVRGADAEHFLQGQLSNDITHLSVDSPHQYNAYCSPKGRILALFHTLKLEDGYALIAPRSIMEKVLPRLKMFVMRSAVEIVPLDGKALIGLYAPGEQNVEALTTRNTHIARHSTDRDRYFLLCDEASEQPLKTSNDWNRLDIEQNLPQIFIENYEALIPQSVNLDIVGGVNFKKGCYPGQEIIARVKYRGKPKTRMAGFKASAVEPVAIGDSVYIDGRNSAAGQVINVAKHDDETLLSISVPVTHIAEGPVYLDESRTTALERLNSPYEIAV